MDSKNGRIPKPNEADALINAAHDEGTLSDASMQALSGVDLGSQIQAGLGISVDDVEASEVLLLTILVDDSGSIQSAKGGPALVRDGYNLVLESLDTCKERDGVLAHTRYLNGKVLYPYRPIQHATRMDAGNYDPSGGTPLYAQTIVTLGAVLAKCQEFSQSGVVARSITLIITDGGDDGTTRVRAHEVAALVSDLKRQEGHIVAAMGIADGVTDFRRVFRDMGIEDRWILTPQNRPDDIRRAFQVFSQSAVRASQSARFASRGGLGGFMN